MNERESTLLMTVTQVAGYVGLAVRTVWRLVSAGQFPEPVRVPGVRATRWRRADVAQWVESLGPETVA